MVDALETFDFDAVWDDVVAQFSEPLSCLRELVQNSIDADSGEVEIEVEFDPVDGDADGRMILHVRDWGVGMDREVIEGRLTELFHSGKAEDYTKIGRFGIGFVSVFALEPTVVCVDTGREGKYWRVLFHDDGNFELYSLGRPIEGTRIRIVRSASREEAGRIRERARKVVGFWCRHASIPVRFEGEDVREPFAVDAPTSVSYREEGTRIAAGLVESADAPYGYYNRGLTLEQGDEGPNRHVAFKIDSRYLEHTLTRDQVVENEDYHKAHERLDSLIASELPAQLIDDLEAAAAGEDGAHHDRLASLLAHYLDEYGEPPGEWRGRPIVPVVGDEPVSLEQCREADGERGIRVYTGDEPVRAEAVADETLLVRGYEGGGGLSRLLRRECDGSIAELRSRYAIPAIRPTIETEGAADLLREIERLFPVIDLGVELVGFGDFYDASPVVDTPVVGADDIKEPLPLDELPASTREELAECDQCLLNLDHDLVGDLLAAAEQEPEWAALSLVKIVCGSDLSPSEDAELVETVNRRRRKRGRDA